MRRDDLDRNQFLEPHLKAMWNLAFQLVLDPSAADDVAQEACVRAIRGHSQFRGGSSLRTWLFRIVINVSRDWYAGRKRSMQGQVIEENAEPATRSHEAPDRAAMQAELEQEVSRAMATLPESLRVALVLTAFHEMAASEVASIEGCTTSTIYWRVHEARKILKKHLEPWTK
jgi:RNA polymerase sigma-70 factor, ECF subfamily